VLLLVVLSMLTLFLLLGTTFLVLASRARSVSKAYLHLAGQQQQSTDSVRVMIRDAALQVMRGTQKRSAMKYHDLLGDRYTGSDEFTISNASATAGGQLLSLTLTPAISVGLTGRVLGFISGPSAVVGTASRIVDADSTSVTLPWPAGLNLANVASLNGKVVRINRRDFDGMGIAAGDIYVPNWSLVTTVSPSSLNEDYDAVDMQNVALAEASQSDPSFKASFHRPAAVDAWLEWYRSEKDLSDRAAAEAEVYRLLQNGAPLASDLNERLVEWIILKQIRRASLRPFSLDHSFVTGQDFAGKTWTDAASFFSLLRGGSGFDIDNDKDGVLDSVWVDFGREAFRMPDRTVVKPLAAIRCIDLGGRLNLNAHGTLAHLLGSPPGNDSVLARDPMRGNSSSVPPNRDLSLDQPVGLGFGPADIRLDAILSRSQLEAVLLGRAGGTFSNAIERIYRKLRGINGRYGGGVRTVANPPLPGATDGADSSSVITPWPGSLPSDYWGGLTMGLNHYGYPATLPWLSGYSDLANSPYEIDLTAIRDSSPYASLGGQTNNDQPFTVSELEACLRRRDADVAALLPQRLLSILLEGDPLLYQQITTESWDTPAIIGDPVGVGGANLEISRGLKMNLNRPFGDGVDNDSDGTVDEPDEIDTYAVAIDPNDVNPNDHDAGSGWNLTRGATIRALPEIDPNTGSPYTDAQPGLNVAGLRVRQIMADNLYHLMQALRPVPLQTQISDRDLAQWSVNVVDFLDSDAIMTPYKYRASGAPDQYVVWGCEHPDLILTETVAFHDRAIADTDDDDGPDDNPPPSGDAGQKTADGSDEDFDQIRVPQGSLFIELHAVRDRQAASLPAELYNGSQGNWALDLGRRPAGGTEPVWRLSITEPRSTGSEDNDPFHAIHNDPTEQFDPPDGDDFMTPSGLATDRYVWFTNTTPSAWESGKNSKPNPYNTFRPANNCVVSCGNYLVAGPRATTWLGSSNAGFGQKGNQEIVLPGNGVVFSADGPDWASIGLNISERFGFDYYPTPPAPNPNSATPLYGPLADSSAKYPDSPGDVGGPLAGVGLEQGTHLNAATVFVERLADPTRPFNPDADSAGWNPYIVVDFMPVDLTVFNGETAANDPSVGAATPWYVHTRQRGFDAWLDQNVDTTDPANPDPKDTELFSVSRTLDPLKQPTFVKHPWRPCSPWQKSGSDWVLRPPQPIETPPLGSANTHFKQNLYTWPGSTSPYTEDDTVPGHSLGWCNLSQGRQLQSPEVPAAYSGAPANPLPWIGWKDGPMASPYELLLVPRTSAARLLTDFREVGSLTDAGAAYTDASGDLHPFGVDNDQPFGATRPGHHLLPLTSITDRPLDANSPSSPVADALSKVFGYVRTQSPFAGTQMVLDGTVSDMPAYFRPPFNSVETYREPGNVNINMIRHSAVWEALLGDEGGVGLEPLWGTVRSVPVSPWRTTTGGRRPGLEGPRQNTLFRDSAPGSGVPLVQTPVLHSVDGNGNPQVRPLPTAFSPTRSPWFRFSPLMRAAANTTTRSEVYAIWVTIGLFEVEPVTKGTISASIDLGGPDPMEVDRYPDAYRFTREYGTTTGEVERYRGFYIFDRSRAITYQMGSDHNIDDAILVERFVE
jgi:hypothetical protein